MEICQRFDLCNLDGLELRPVRAHGGQGAIDFARVAGADQLEGACNFIDLAIVPPGASIGRHAHAADEEEFYLVLSGRGRMWRDGREIDVAPGDLIRTPPGGSHGLVNSGDEALRLFVFEVRVTR